MIADPRHGGGVSDEQKPRRFLKADIKQDCPGSRYQKLLAMPTLLVIVFETTLYLYGNHGNCHECRH